MRTILLIPKLNAGADVATTRLLSQKDLNIVGIIRSDISPFRKSWWKYLAYGVRRSGLFYGFIIGLTVHLHLFGAILASILWWRRKKKTPTMVQLAESKNIPLIEIENINSRETIKQIHALAPDLLLSLYFDQILKKNVLNIAKQGNLNMHPGILPKYRGLWPNFWKLYNKEKFAGVTIHKITEKIDEGEIVAFTKYRIGKKDTNYSLILKSAIKGSQLLTTVIRNLKQNIKIPKIQLEGKANYYSLPNKHQFQTFFARRNHLFSITDIT